MIGCVMPSEILKMIEEVDPSDTAKLDEIDARACCYLNTTYTQKFMRMINRCGKHGDGFEYKYYSNIGGVEKKGIRDQNLCIRFTRSRDALKAIRPEGWFLESKWLTGNKGKPFGQKNGDIWKALASGYSYEGSYGEIGSITRSVRSSALPTEELAELHAIIQAIAYERGRQRTCQ